jgi:pyruvate/2-oxoacid:ferredoxin oxidoreductase beta subunit
MKFAIAGFFFLILFSSCENEAESELMTKYKEQQIVLKELQDDLTRVRREIEKNEIADPAPDLRKIKDEIKQLKTEKEDLLIKIKALKVERETKMKEFEDYQKNYPIRSK